MLALVPSGRSVAVGLALAVAAVGGYVAARETSAFAITTIEVRGTDAEVASDLRRALEPLVGTSLLSLVPKDVERLALTLPRVASVHYDRAFPHALVLRVEAEQPIAVARSGTAAWLVSSGGRVIEKLAPGARLGLPRLWLPRSADVRIGTTLAAGAGADEIAALVPVRRAGFGGRVTTVRRAADGRVSYRLRGGVEVRAGRPVELRLKLVVAARILRQNAVREYLDVSVPSRPVGLIDPQLSG